MQGVRSFLMIALLGICAAILARASVKAGESMATMPPAPPQLTTKSLGLSGGTLPGKVNPPAGERSTSELPIRVTDAANKDPSSDGTGGMLRFYTGEPSPDSPGDSLEQLDPGVVISDHDDLSCDPNFAPSDLPTYGNLWNDYHHRGRLWARGEYLNWRVRGDYLPPLVTTAPAGTPQAQAGALGFDTTTVLFGDDRVNNEERSGGRITVGYGLLDGIQFDYWILENPAERFDASSFGDPILARPIFNVNTSVSSQDFIAFPNFMPGNFDIAGVISIETSSEFQSGGFTLSHMLWMDSSNPTRRYWRANFLIGYRYFELREGVLIREANFFNGGPFAPGSRRDRFEEFNTKNLFHGGEIGLAGYFQCGRFSVDMTGKVALGNMYSRMHVDGQTFDFDPITGISTPLGGGLLAGPARIGTRSRDDFAAIPEVNLMLGLQLTPNVKMTAGYTYIYMPHVVRPGDNIHLSVNPADPANVPVIALRDIDLWITGANAGLEVRF